MVVLTIYRLLREYAHAFFPCTAGGLGRAFALQLVQCQVKTLILSARNETSLEQVVSECQEVSSSTTTIHIVTCDLSHPQSVTQLGRKALELCNDTVDVLINNGGVSSRSTFLETTPEVDSRIMQINFLSGASLAKALVPGMIQQASGTIVWMSGFQGLRK